MSFRRFVARRFWDDERAREIDAHIAIETDENVARGMAPDEAKAAALRKFGNPLSIREEIYDMNSIPSLESLWQDLRHAARLLGRSPGFACVAILSLALGIGANTAIFSILDALILKTLPVKEPQQLIEINLGNARSGGLPNPIWENLRDHLPPQLSGAFAWSARRFNLAKGGEARHAEGVIASGGYFDTLGVRAILGRVFTAADDKRGGGPAGAVAVISYGFWQKSFAGDPGVIGKSLALDGNAFEIIGVTPKGFFGTDVGRSYEIAIPLFAEAILRPEGSALDNRNNYWLSLIGRVLEGTTLEQASGGLNTAAAGILEAVPVDPRKDRDSKLATTFQVRPAANGRSSLRTRYAGAIWLLLAVVGVVLLIACANIANLLLARAAGRQREFGVRIAIGAGRARLVRQLLTESLLLAAIGGGLGVLFAQWGSRLLVQFLSTATTRVALDIGLDQRMLGFTAAVTVLTAILFGLVPAFRASGLAPNAALKAARSISSGGPARLRLGKLLVVTQVALSLVLLFGAGLFLRTLHNLTSLDTGFETADVLLVSLDIRNAGQRPEQRAAFYKDVLERLRAIPGVRAASQAQITPISGWSMGYGADVPGYTPLTRSDRNVFFNRVSDQYFRTFATPLLAGRDFEARDTPESPTVAIVNETLARRFTGNAVGQSFSQGPNTRYEVIGVVKDAKYEKLRDQAPSTAYFPMSQDTRPGTSAEFQVRSNVAAVASVRSVREAVLAADKNISLSFKTFATQVNDSLVQERLIAALCGFFALLAIALVLIGLQGLIAYGVARRRNEIGIRMALGADRPRVLWLVLRDVLLLTTLGTFLGLVASLGLTRFVESMLYGLAPNDPLTMASAAALLVTLGMLAGYLPARRAASLHPMDALREE